MQVIPYQQFSVQDLTKLPPHITFSQYRALVSTIQQADISIKKKAMYLLLIQLSWETGGRVGDIVRIIVQNFNFDDNILRLSIKKRRGFIIEIPLTNDLVFNVRNYIALAGVKDVLFPITRQRAWQVIREYGDKAGIKDLHPHKFRHGLAIHLMNQGVAIPVISARLGHTNIMTTMRNYMKITPEIQRQSLEHVEWK